MGTFLRHSVVRFWCVVCRLTEWCSFANQSHVACVDSECNQGRTQKLSAGDDGDLVADSQRRTGVEPIGSERWIRRHFEILVANFHSHTYCIVRLFLAICRHCLHCTEIYYRHDIDNNQNAAENLAPLRQPRFAALAHAYSWNYLSSNQMHLTTILVWCWR